MSVSTNWSKPFYAHSLKERPEVEWHPLKDHLLEVGKLAESFAEVFGAGPLAYVQGCLHDLGKYTFAFQQRIRGLGGAVDHSTWGAIETTKRYGPVGTLLAYGIAGHHAGLADGKGGVTRTPLDERLCAELPPLDTRWQTELPLPASLSLENFKPHQKRPAEWASFQQAFLARMLFSCLVDADYLDTESFYRQAEGKSARCTERPALPVLLQELDQYLAQFHADSPVNVLRAEILSHVRAHAGELPGLFSLTVPTGGGKTLASLAFALEHAIRHGMNRVIFVIPFTSVVEQNAEVFRNALGKFGEDAVLEHHSAFVDDPAHSSEAREKLQLAMENWDAPIVVTTAVQFFESLFAARPSQCRKLHNVAGSVVVVDEAQTMPLKLLRPCVAALDELARNYRTSVVLCTATQPALTSSSFPDGLEGVRELAPEPAELFRKLQRVRVRHIGRLDDEALTALFRTQSQALCIVNNRLHARAAYQAIADLPGAYHLSTLMCAKHRSEVLNKVREQLRLGLPCICVSTSLIEAGVDVDFPLVLRAQAGLDSIAQAAGRCNREGRRDVQESEVLIFIPENEQWAPPPELTQFAQAAAEVLRSHSQDPLSPAAIEEYFGLLYWQKGSRELDAPGLLAMLRTCRVDSLPLETIATQFRMIDSVQMPVIVPWDEKARELLRSLDHVERCSGIARALQPYVVQLPRQAFEALEQAGAVAPVAPHKWGGQFVSLLNKDLYDKHFGLHWDEPTYLQPGNAIW